MAASSGNGGVLQTSPDDSTYSAIASLQSWTLEQSADTIETTEMGTSLAKTFIPGQTSFSGSAEALWNDDDTSQESIQTALSGGDSTFFIKLYPIGSSRRRLLFCFYYYYKLLNQRVIKRTDWILVFVPGNRNANS